MNINEVFPSKYLKTSDLNGKSVKLIIDRIELEEIGDGKKPVLYFSGKNKGLVLNKTNANIIAGSYSPNTDGWVGKEIRVYPSKVNFNGQMVDALKVEVVPEVGEFKDDELPPF